MWSMVWGVPFTIHLTRPYHAFTTVHLSHLTDALNTILTLSKSVKNMQHGNWKIEDYYDNRIDLCGAWNRHPHKLLTLEAWYKILQDTCVYT